MRRGHLHAGAAPALLLLLAGCQMDVLHPEGPVGVREVTLIAFTLAAMLIVVIPVIFMTIFFAWRYRASNTKAVYQPDFVYSRKLEITIWSVPLVIVVFLCAMDWRSTLALDPYRELPIAGPVLTVDVVAMDWKWLFIYPDQHVAAVNQLVIPVHTQVAFNITSESVMNVFFIPRLGTQIYAMSGMDTQLHLLAKNPGTFEGFSANFSGPGFPDMRFEVRAVSGTDFNNWVTHAQRATLALDDAMYQNLAGPTKNNPVMYFGNVDLGLFNKILAEHSGMAKTLPAQETE